MIVGRTNKAGRTAAWGIARLTSYDGAVRSYLEAASRPSMSFLS